MERTRLRALPDHTGTKRVIVLLGVLLAAVLPLTALIDPPLLRLGVLLLALLLGGILVYRWAYLDSLEVAERLSPVLGAALILFSIPVLCIYLLHSRGIRYGLRSVGKAFLLLAALFLVSAAVLQVMELRVW